MRITCALAIAALLTLAGSLRADVIYTLTGTTNSRRFHTFQYTAPGFFRPGHTTIPTAQLNYCGGCEPVFGVSFSPNNASFDQIGFFDVNNTSYGYSFPRGAFAKPGVHQTVPGWPHVATLTVEVTPISIVNAASYRFGTAPDAIVSIFGNNLAAAVQTAASETLPVSLGGTTVRLWSADDINDSVRAPLLMVSPNQVNIVVPPVPWTGPTMVTVTNSSGDALSGPTRMVAAAPGLFSADGSGAGTAAGHIVRVRPDGSRQTEELASPIVFGDDSLTLVVFGTGFRHPAKLQTACWIDWQFAATAYVGPVQSAPGVDQLNVPLPRRLIGAGTVDLFVQADGRRSNVVTLTFR